MAEAAVKVEKKCRIEKCRGAYRAKGYCTRHYRKWRQGEYGDTRYKVCTHAECKKKRFKEGCCETHYKELLAARHPEKVAVAAPAAAAPAVAAPETPKSEA